MPEAQSGSSTSGTRFTTQAQTSEDALKQQTVGLVHLNDFRKRRAGAFDQGMKSEEGSTDERVTISKPVSFKRKKALKRGGLSFGDDETTTDEDSTSVSVVSTLTHTSKKRLKPNADLGPAPKSQSRSALAHQTKLREALKQEYLQTQEAVRATDFVLPFVFFDGKDSVGGKVRMKKGDHLWLFLERARKVGAESSGTANGARKDWARISVDDLMLVKNDLIIPAHFDFHYFILNKTRGYRDALFNYSSDVTNATPAELLRKSSDANADSMPSADSVITDSELEGFSDDPAATRVVDRRWYEKNKHIYPASLWEDFDVQRDYSKGGRKDRDGNQMFFFG